MLAAIASLLITFCAGQIVLDTIYLPMTVSHGSPATNPSNVYWYSGGQGPGTTSTASYGGGGNYAPKAGEISPEATRMGIDRQYVAEHAYLDRIDLTDSRPRPVYTPSQRSQHLKTAKQKVIEQNARKDRVRELVKTMDQSEARLEIVNEAVQAIRLSRDYYKEEKYEEGEIAAHIGEIFLDIATSTAPVISWFRDTYEAITGKDLHTGEALGSFSRSMAVLGAVTIGFGNKAIKALEVFEKMNRTADSFSEARKLLYSKPIFELKETLTFYRKYQIYGKPMDKMGVSITNAFLKDARVELTKGRLYVVRYSQKGGKGYWVTTKEIADPHNLLALMHNDPVQMSRLVIKKDAEILRGIAAPQKELDMYGKVLYDRPGGAEQILVDPKFLE